MREFDMQNIIKLGLLGVLCVSTSVWADGLQRSDSEMSDLCLPPPAVGIHLGERLSQSKDSDKQIKCMTNAIKCSCTKKEYKRMLETGILVTPNGQKFSSFKNTKALLETLVPIMEESKQKALVFTFNGKKYEIQGTDDEYGAYEILDCYK
jgi:hypothetical protein